MKAIVQVVTPEIATTYLKGNEGNRRTRDGVVEYYARLMREGGWKENGEPVIIDKLGVLKDGQHRLQAIVKSGVACKMPIITEVEPDVMDTIDTGENRSLADVLYLSGIKNSVNIAALARKILNTTDQTVRKDSKRRRTYVTNAIGLKFVLENDDALQRTLSISNRLYQKSKILTVTEIGRVFYVLNGLNNPEEEHIEFVKELLGINRTEGTAATWVSNTLTNLKRQGTPVNKKWRLGIIIKAWNSYINGNAQVRYLKFDQATPFPKVEPVNRN